MPNIKIFAVLASMAALLINPALAWNDQGHMMVAAVAFDQLTPQTKARVAALLALSQYPSNGQNDAPAADQDKAAFMMAATAPDAIKKDRQQFVDDGEDPSRAPDAARNTGFDDPNMHKYWHYIDEPFSPDQTPLVQPPSINVAERVALFRQSIASDAPDALKAYDLIWLLHLVGDVHQPLHATSRFTRDGDPQQGDRGGNAVKLCDTPHCRAELHAFWDGVLGKSEMVSAALRAASRLPAPPQVQAEVTDVAVWVNESFQSAQRRAYAPPIGPTNGPFVLDATYKTDAKAEAERRVALAGARLAKLLNDNLK